MERRATQGYKYARKVIDMPDNTISLQISLDVRRSEFEAVKSSSMNVNRRLWNAFPVDLKSENPARFKKAVSSQEIYLRVANKGAVRRVENHM
uniref:Uncharacterized protein n=1 Tax=Acrobeloides nanus TaxID=290746 RepID=A0A914EBJ6_9BILA